MVPCRAAVNSHLDQFTVKLITIKHNLNAALSLTVASKHIKCPVATCVCGCCNGRCPLLHRVQLGSTGSAVAKVIQRTQNFPFVLPGPRWWLSCDQG